MPNPHGSDFKQLTQEYKYKPGVFTPSQEPNKSNIKKATPPRSGKTKPPTYMITSPLRTESSSKRTATGNMSLKKSESGSKMIIDLTASSDKGWIDTKTNTLKQNYSGVSGHENQSPEGRKRKLPAGFPSSEQVQDMSEKLTLYGNARKSGAGKAPVPPQALQSVEMPLMRAFSGMGGGGSGPRVNLKHREVKISNHFLKEAGADLLPPKKAKNEKPTRIVLSEEQEQVAAMVMNDKVNIFFTGSAGTGKSVLLRELITRLKTIHGKEGVAITASTGIAAFNIGGITLHSFAGCGLAQDKVDKLIHMATSNRRTATRWKKTKVLIIDEVSMVDGDFLDKLNQIAQAVRVNVKPFGGIQLVLCGDFMQLPPVGSARYAFQSLCWKKCVTKTVLLTQVFRQKDARFVNLLNEMRVGIVSPETETLLQSLSRDLEFNDGIEPTRLYPLRMQVESANNQRLAGLNTPVHTFVAQDYAQREYDRAKLKDFLALPVLELKIGSQVMLIKNIDETLVNGSLGRVVSFDEQTSWPVVQFIVNGEAKYLQIETEQWTVEIPGQGVIASRTQVPLILAWSMSIHKAQGQTLERVSVDLSKVFEKGQSYVALSRATTLEGLQVRGFSRDKVRVDQTVIEFNKTLESVGKAKALCPEKSEHAVWRPATHLHSDSPSSNSPPPPTPPAKFAHATSISGYPSFCPSHRTTPNNHYASYPQTTSPYTPTKPSKPRTAPSSMTKPEVIDLELEDDEAAFAELYHSSKRNPAPSSLTHPPEVIDLGLDEDNYADDMAAFAEMYH